MDKNWREACKSLQEQIGPPARDWGDTDGSTLDFFVQLFWGQDPTYEDYKYVFGDKHELYYKSEEAYYSLRKERNKQMNIKRKKGKKARI